MDDDSLVFFVGQARQAFAEVALPFIEFMAGCGLSELIESDPL